MVEFWLENLLRLRYCRKILNADQNSRRVVTETFVASRASSGWWMILMWQKFRPKSAATRRERGGGRTTPPWLSIYLLSNYGGEREDPTEMSEREFWKPTARYYYLNVLINIRSYTGSVRATSLILSEMIIGWMLTVESYSCMCMYGALNETSSLLDGSSVRTTITMISKWEWKRMRKDLENTDRLTFLFFFCSLLLCSSPLLALLVFKKLLLHHRHCRTNTANNTLPLLTLLSLFKSRFSSSGKISSSLWLCSIYMYYYSVF